MITVEYVKGLLEEYELPTTTWDRYDFDNVQWGGARRCKYEHGWGSTSENIAKRLNAVPALLDRMAFLERVAEQMIDLVQIGYEPNIDRVVGEGWYLTSNDKHPDLAAYLRERASDAGQEVK